MKAERDQNKFELWRNELRTVSYFVIKSAMGDTNHISSPRDLYRLHIDEQFEEMEEEKFKSVQFDKEFAQFADEFLKKNPN